MIRLGCALAVAATLGVAAAALPGGCSADGPAGSGGRASTTISTSSTPSMSTSTTSVASGGAGGALPLPTVEPPEGWHRWPVPPDDCAIFVPDELSAIGALDWQPCPFMLEGCRLVDAPWHAETGWGYGGMFDVALIAGHRYVALSRKPEKPYWWEMDLWRDDVPIGAWRVWNADGGGCVLGGPWLRADGMAALEAVRIWAEGSPYVYLGPVDSLFAGPTRIETFDGIGAPNALLRLSDRLLVVLEHYGRFAVRDLELGTTVRPEPPGQPYASLTSATAVGERVLYRAWTGNLASLWIWQVGGESAPLLRDTTYSYDAFATDGVDMVWSRSRGQLGINEFETVELWASPFATSAAGLAPVELPFVPETVPPESSIGEGWVAVRHGVSDVWLVRLSDHATRVLPPASVDGKALGWNGGRQLAIVGGELWAHAYFATQAGNNIRFVVRFELDRLPEP